MGADIFVSFAYTKKCELNGCIHFCGIVHLWLHSRSLIDASVTINVFSTKMMWVDTLMLSLIAGPYPRVFLPFRDGELLPHCYSTRVRTVIENM